MQFTTILFILSTTWVFEPEGLISPLPTLLKEEITNLEQLINKASSDDLIFLKKGQYEASPKPYLEIICGNCENPITDVKATVGFHVKEKTLVIIGQDKDSTILITNSGYDVLFENSYGSLITNLTVTGGIRDPDWKATNAGIVGKNCRVTVENIRIINNTKIVDTVNVGIGGVIGREGAELYIIGNEIANNTWDGIALYRGASAVITDNIIEKGRGAGIGITWDASAQVYRNNAVYNNSGW
jgi:hypothetical protein